jgi:putative ABC transport system permease protein
MSLDLLERGAPVAVSGESRRGGGPARRAMIRWAWRLFRREWRQQLLILALVTVAVAATFVGAAVATDAKAPANAGFGTAQDLGLLSGTSSSIANQVGALAHRFGRVDLIENQVLNVPGSITTYDLRAQNPDGPFGRPMLSLVSGRYPTGSGQVALTSGLATSLQLRIGDTWREGGRSRRVVGLVQNPQSLLDEFALVVPGQVTTPTQVTALFDAHGVRASSLGQNFESVGSTSSNNPINPETIVLALATIGMLLISLVAVGGFTVLAQRRMRSIGMLGALGATDQDVGRVIRANGLVVGVAGAVLGTALGLVAWLAYRPHAEASAHHLIGVFALPWVVIVVSMALAVVATYYAASRPARAIARVPIVTALSGRPAAPKQIHRSAVPGVLIGVVAFFLLASAGGSQGGGGGPQLIFGLVALIAAIVLLAPLSLAVLAKVAGPTPIAARLAVRDLSRYRARSGSALAAISLGVLIAVLVCVLAASRYGNVLDYAGPNLASNQVDVYTSNGPGAPSSGTSLASMTKTAHTIAVSLGATKMVELEQTGANLQHAAAGRQWSGDVYVATPQLLRAFGIPASDVNPKADVLTMRPGLSSLSNMQLLYGRGGARGEGSGQDQPRHIGPGQGNGPPTTFPCPKASCVANPVIQEVSALPSGTSAPNTVITEHAVRTLHLQVSPAGWLIQSSSPPSPAQISDARATAAAANMSIETKNSAPSSAEIINWATVFGVALALGILGMTIGLIRSETASDLRILSATGASSSTRRSLTAATAGSLGLLGAVLGTVAAYVAAIAYTSRSKLDGLSSLGNIPARNLLLILIGMPLVAAAVAWLFSGRQQADLTHQPLE